jgi:hypothetical protein
MASSNDERFAVTALEGKFDRSHLNVRCCLTAARRAKKISDES